MRTLAIITAAAAFAATAASAQNTPATNTPATTQPATTQPATTGTSTATTATSTAGNDNNQSVATTTGNAATPAKGSNSFTMGQAQTRIAKQGFSDVADLKKDEDGIWRGQAKKGDQQVAVWLDYKGNVGQQ